MVDAERSAPQLERHKDQLRESPGNYKTGGTNTMTDTLAEITPIHEQRTEVHNRPVYLAAQRNTLIRDADQSGRTIAELSRAAGVSRNPIYRIDHARKPEPACQAATRTRTNHHRSQ